MAVTQKQLTFAREFNKRLATQDLFTKTRTRPLQNSLFKICSFHHIFVPL